MAHTVAHSCPVTRGKASKVDVWSSVLAQDHFPGGHDGHRLLENQLYTEHETTGGVLVQSGVRLQAKGWSPDKPQRK